MTERRCQPIAYRNTLHTEELLEKLFFLLDGQPSSSGNFPSLTNGLSGRESHHATRLRILYFAIPWADITDLRLVLTTQLYHSTTLQVSFH